MGHHPWRARVHDPGWLLLPLRVFLAVVFLDAGISKVAGPSFLDGSTPTSVHASVLAVRDASPVGGLLGPVAAHSFAFGLFFAIAELAVGLGLALGLFTRIAAAGGMVLSLSLWLTISWGASPWFTSADVVYLFALTPLLIAGAGLLSLDGWLGLLRARRPDPREDRVRRGLLAVGAAVLGGVVMGGAALARPSRRSAKHRQIDTALPANPLIKAADVPVGGAARASAASADEPVWVLQLDAGAFTAFDARCPHQGCIVDFVSAADGFACPCHQSHFDARGQRLSGPTPRGLTPVAVTVKDGEVSST